MIIDSMWVWRRPYRDPFRVFTGFFVLVGCAFAGVVLVGVAVGHSEFPGAKALAVAFMAVWLTVAWRIHRTGPLVGDAGVRVRWLLKTRTVRWDDIDGFRFGEDILGNDRLWINLSDGWSVRTPIQRVGRLIPGSRVSDGGTWLRSGDCDVLLRDLEHELRCDESARGLSHLDKPALSALRYRVGVRSRGFGARPSRPGGQTAIGGSVRRAG